MHTIVVDLSYGDSGKGTIVDWLCAHADDRPVTAVVRFNGGAQAAHNVVTPDGRHHTFAQLGSGTFTPGVVTHLSRFMLVEPLALAAEADHLAAVGVPDALDRLTVDRQALLTTPYHRAANRAREAARGDGRHGSCGMGIGETMAYAIDHPDAPVVGDCQTPDVLRTKLRHVRDRLQEELDLGDIPPLEAIVDAYRAFAGRVAIVDDTELRRLLHTGPVVFEGAQGVLLDEWRGFHPYTTWSTTTFDNAETLLAEAGIPGEAFRLGVLRTYTTRHGAGPLVTEDVELTRLLPEPHNHLHPWQGEFRVGHFDAVAHRYAIEVCGGVDGVALTHLDRAARVPELALCQAYEIDGSPVRRLEPGPFRDLDHQEQLTRRLQAAQPIYTAVTEDWVSTIGDTLGAPVVATSFGPTADQKQGTAVGRRSRADFLVAC